MVQDGREEGGMTDDRDYCCPLAGILLGTFLIIIHALWDLIWYRQNPFDIF